jgi:hypothetical protein
MLSEARETTHVRVSAKVETEAEVQAARYPRLSAGVLDTAFVHQAPEGHRRLAAAHAQAKMGAHPKFA